MPFYSAFSQQIINDKANAAQMDRMVFYRWDNWQPTPDWHKVFGVPVWPKNPLGAAYWGVLHRRYWKGNDLRPYKAGGPGQLHLGSLASQVPFDERIADSLKVVMTNHLTEYASKAGGMLDIPYTTYFKEVFSDLEEHFISQANKLSLKTPKGYMAFIASDFYRGYQVFLETTKSDIKAVNESYSDRGKKINAYLEIKRKWERINKHGDEVIGRFASVTKNKENLKGIIIPKVEMGKSDAELVKEILRKHRF